MGFILGYDTKRFLFRREHSKLYDQPRQHIKKQRHYFADKSLFSQSCGFSSSHVWMWELDYKESRAPKNWCFWTAVLEKNLESPLDYKEIQPVHRKGNQSWIFIGRTDAQAETPLLWPPDAKKWLIGKGGEGDNRGWDGWMASLTRWTWVWASSGSWWWTGKSTGECQSMGSQESDTTERLKWWHQNATNGYFLNVSCKMEPETTSHSDTLKSISLSCTLMVLLSMYHSVVPPISLLKNIGWLSDRSLPNMEPFH